MDVSDKEIKFFQERCCLGTNNITTMPTSTAAATTTSSSFPTSPSSVQTQPSSTGSTSSNTSPATSSQSTGPTTTPAPGSYYPCKNWITVLADNSNKLTAPQFQVIQFQICKNKLIFLGTIEFYKIYFEQYHTS